jgi:hypothetical protein
MLSRKASSSKYKASEALSSAEALAVAGLIGVDPTAPEPDDFATRARDLSANTLKTNLSPTL